MSSLLVFTPDIAQPSLTVSAELTTTQMSAIHAFMNQQNTQAPGKYPTELSLIASNLRTGLLANLVTTYPPSSDPVPMSGIVFVPDPLNPQDNQQGDIFTDDQMRALATFTAQQNSERAGLYTGTFDVIMSNLHDDLLAALVGLYPPSTVSTAQAGVTTAEATLAAAVSASNPRAAVGTDPAEIPPYDR